MYIIKREVGMYVQGFKNPLQGVPTHFGGVLGVLKVRGGVLGVLGVPAAEGG